MTSWWNKNIETRLDDFITWTGESNQPSKTYCRQYIVDKQYKTLIDCGCGLATDYYAFKQEGHQIDYTGLDSCKYLVDLNKSKGIAMVEAELNAALPLPDNSYDCVYCREVLEHLPYYEKTIEEFVRIASKEIIIVFFIKPLNENEWEEEIKNRKNKIKKDLWDKQDTERRKRNKDRWVAWMEYRKTVRNPDPEPEPEPEISIEDMPDPEDKEDKEINYWPTEDLYHNKYDKKKLEAFIMSLPKVDKLSWVSVDDFGYVTVIEEEPLVNPFAESAPTEEAVEPMEPLTEVQEPVVVEEQEHPVAIKPTENLTNNKFILHIFLK